MSITSDVRGYADTAIEQGRQALAQAQGRITGTVTELRAQAEKAVSTVNAGALRAQAERAVNTVNTGALRAAVEPYLEQACSYTHSVTERVADGAGTLLATAKKDPRVAKAFGTAESVGTLAIDTVQQRVVTPVRKTTAGKGTAGKGTAGKGTAGKGTARTSTTRKASPTQD